MARDCGHTGTGMTWFDVGADCLALCSRCYAAVTQPWHDKLRETSAALAEAQRERDEARAEASKWKHLCSGAVRLKRVRDARLDAIRQALEQNKDDALVRVEARWLVDCAQSEIEFPERQRREELDTAVDRAIREARVS